MEKTVMESYVFSPQAASAVLGPNDSNLSYLEALLRTDLSVRGTSISSSSQSPVFIPLMKRLEKEAGIPTHLIEELSDTDTAVRKVSIVPLEVIVRNIIAGSLSKRVGIEEGVVLPRPVLEFCYKDDALGDPMVNDSHILALGWATEEELETIKDYALRVNSYLRDFFSSIGIDLVDFKLEFGRTPDGRIVLADEISPDTCRFWDSKTKKKLDKDRFRRDLGDAEGAYKEMLTRIFGA